ncbi:MAG: DUF6064 family protein [Candidatus Competibacterales bacterium]|nr:DUF6064 family protein [Candidatus Competibacterales bacterium]
MELPFTIEAFFRVFADYNRAIGPMPVLAYLLGLAVVVLAWRPAPWAGRTIGGILAGFWLWMGIVYHGLFFAPINPAAYAFGGLFVVQAALLAWQSVIRDRLWFPPRRDPRAVVGWLAIAYALLLYPLLGQLAGHGYPRAPLFGVAPCPTTIFTLGLLLLADRVPGSLWPIPLLWSLIGGTAAWLLAVPEDLGLWAAGLATIVLLLTDFRHGPSRNR